MSQARRPSKKSRSLPLFREWRIPEPPDSCLIDRVRNEASVLPEVAALLLQRSGGDIERARQMREHGEVAIPDVLSLPGVKEAALRILEAISSGQRIVAYSDFDADGVTSAAVIKEALGFAGAADVQVYFPSRFTEGYGFHARSVREIASPGKCLIITSDCGITAVEGCAEAEKLGCDVIITDHHLPGETLPQAHSILNPHLPSWGEAGLQGLTGAGVAYLLAQALFEVAGVRAKVPLRWGHDLLVLSIAGDGQPLTGLNRRFVVSGLRVLSEARRPGISALLEAAGIGRPDPLQPGCCTSLSFDRDVTFGLVPRLNAAGRLEDARLAYDILVETDPARVRSLALRLDELNRKRKGIEDAIMAQCVGDLEASSGDSYAVCAARSEWHEGVIGIAASKLREAYARPAALAGGDGELLKGSVRGIPGFNVVKALSRCARFLAGYGGHEAAGGFSVRRESVEEFFREFNSVSAELLANTSMCPTLDLDAEFALEQLSEETLRAFYDLEPFGQGNPCPQAASLDCEVTEVGLMGKDRGHLEVTLSKNGVSRRFIWFGMGEAARKIALTGRVDVAFAPYRSVYLGREQVTPLIRDIRPSWQRSGAGYEDLLSAASSIPGGPLIIYTWSLDAAESIRIAARKSGRPAAVHLEGYNRVQAHEARLTLEGDGVVISTAPWELMLPGERAGRAFLAHLPLRASAAELLTDFLGGSMLPYEVWSRWEADSLDWLSRTYPEKDSLASVWKLLKKLSSGDRTRCCELAAEWVGSREGSFEGNLLILEKSLEILEELGMVEYGETRRVPEFRLGRCGERILLSNSPSYVEGKSVREGAEETWRGRLCAHLLDRRGI